MDNQFYSNLINIFLFFFSITVQQFIHKYRDSINPVQRIEYYKIFLFQLFFFETYFRILLIN